MREIEWVTRNGKRIAICRFDGLSGEEFVAQVNHYTVGLKIEGERTGSVRFLTDVTGAVIDTAALEQFKIGGREVKDIVEKSALLGITGIRKVMVRVVAPFAGFEAKIFDTEEEALNWLAED